jgi:pyruvate dehydrogenase E2 component (dihydrolipoamide acetyltransferase)
MVEFRLPDVGEGMHEAEIVRWLVQVGETVKLDQPMVEIQTDKALVEIPSPVAGRVIEIKAPVGKMAQLGEVLVVLEPQEAKVTATGPARTAAPASIHEQLRETAPASAPVQSSAASVLAERVAAGSSQAQMLPQRVRAAPAVRKLAWELGVDITQVKPSSKDGRVLIEDVKAYAARPRNGANGTNGVAQPPVIETTPLKVSAAPDPVLETDHYADTAPTSLSFPSNPAKPLSAGPGEEEHRPLVGLRRRIAERMEQSWRTIPHVTSFDEADATKLIELRESLKSSAEKRGQKLTYLPFVIKATLIALKEYPIFNATLDEASREIVYKRYYNIGLATSTPDGLLVSVVRQADRYTTFELAAEIARLSEGARKRSLTPAELSGSTFTITNFGSYGSAVGTPIINPPEVAILGVGRVQEKVVPLNGQPVVRSVLPFCLSFDHRVIDGADSGDFMNRLKALLENPALLLLDC